MQTRQPRLQGWQFELFRKKPSAQEVQKVYVRQVRQLLEQATQVEGGSPGRKPLVQVTQAVLLLHSRQLAMALQALQALFIRKKPTSQPKQFEFEVQRRQLLLQPVQVPALL
jgi:hypothetical protein